MKYLKILKISGFLTLLALQACSSFNYKTYDEKSNENIDDPLPNYNITLDQDFQDFTSFMFIGNRIENFSTYFNTYFNAKEGFDDAYDDYVTRVLANYNERQDSIFARPRLSQESIDKFNIAIEKASKVIQYHKSSEFMDKSVLLVGKAYYYLGDYLKAERKFSEFISKLKTSRYLDEALLYLARTQLRLDNEKPAIERLTGLTKTSKDKGVVSESYQSIAEYYLNKKDYENAIKNFKKAIELSKDSEFKAQMQFLVASVTARSNPKSAAAEFDKVLDYSVSFDLEYLARFNRAKNLILSKSFGNAKPLVEDLEVKYKDNLPYLAQISYLKGFYFEEKNEYKNAVSQYYEVIKNFPSTVASSDASFMLGDYYENNKKDYLNAYRYYKFSTEQNSAGLNYRQAVSKMNVFKRYFELRSIIVGAPINTDYDIEFKKKTSNTPIDPEGPSKDDGSEGNKSGGNPMSLSADSLISMDSTNDSNATFIISEDSVKNLSEGVAKAKFEIAELFLYDLNRPDSCEYYLLDALGASENYDFKAKVLFALAAFYRNTDNNSKSEEILKQIVSEYSLSEVANSSRRLLNISVVEDVKSDPADSLYNEAAGKFLNKDYPAALSGFREIAVTYPTSSHLEKALYGAGWIYENILMKNDSAYFYYSSLVKSIPNSEGAAMVSQKIAEYETIYQAPVDTSGILKDSVGIIKDTTSIDPEQLNKELDESEKSLQEKGKDLTPPVEENMKKEEDAPVEDPSKNQ